MRSSFVLLACCLLATLFANASPAASADTPSADTSANPLRPLFNGRDLEGWHGMGHFDPRELAAMTAQERQARREADDADMRAHWRVEDGELVNDGKGVYLTTDQEYGDIELILEYKTVPLADSGVYLRGTPQVQIWDTTEAGGKWNIGAGKGSGGLWNNSPGAAGKDPLVLADRPFGEWNKLRVVQVGARTWVWLNDQQVVDHAIMENFWDRQSPLFATGPIQLQTHGGEIRWRNLMIRELHPAEANQLLAAHGAEGFQPVFAGGDLSNWRGPVDNYEVVAGSLRCQEGKGGTIYTADEYGDFVARLEFKLPPGGNNGLAIRYPGSGDTAYVGMCELQILDDDAPKYAQLDPRQYHGSAYGMVAAHRGYLRPAGEWNFQEVTVEGSKIRVELNGNVILDTDLSQVKEFMAGSPHPGKDRTRGHFGLAGHSDPVEFRNISIKEITMIARRPVIISTWEFGLPGNEAAFRAIQEGGSALDGVEQGIRLVESAGDPSVGLSGRPNAAGYVQLDACIMDGPGHRAGAVAALEGVRHPISAARLVMEKTPHVMLVGAGARFFALQHGLETVAVDDHAEKLRRWEAAQQAGHAQVGAVSQDPPSHDTMTMLVLHPDGTLAGGCSTSGLAGKLPGRVGDSPIIGSGLYVDQEVGAAGATGLGENIMRYCAALLIVEQMRQGSHPAEACRQVLQRLARSDPAGENLQINFIALDTQGRVGAAGQPGFPHAVTYPGFSQVVRYQ